MADERETPKLVYANVVQLTTGPFDLVMEFGFKTPEQTLRGSTEYEPVVRVAMSLSHAKTMIPALVNQITQYEAQVGEIPAPGFQEPPKE
jgi:hypothetical protein